MAKKEEKKKLEIKTVMDPSTGLSENQIYIDEEFFDWGIDEESLNWAIQQGPEYYAAAQKDIAKHFLESLSEMVGRKVTLPEFNKALQTGWI
jgi:hypothetical protein